MLPGTLPGRSFLPRTFLRRGLLPCSLKNAPAHFCSAACFPKPCLRGTFGPQTLLRYSLRYNISLKVYIAASYLAAAHVLFIKIRIQTRFLPDPKPKIGGDGRNNLIIGMFPCFSFPVLTKTYLIQDKGRCIFRRCNRMHPHLH
jgi:hypothetical protein